MPGKVILGAQWGDEGKGKFIDIFAAQADLVVRSQGGNNAGHTVVVNGETYKLQLIPSGILYPNCINVIGPGVVVNPKAVLGEIDGLHEKGVSTDKLFIDARCHCILPWHLELDALSEAEKAKEGTAIGTTKNGIGPAYSDKVARMGLRVSDLRDLKMLEQKLASYKEQIAYLQDLYDLTLPSVESIMQNINAIAPKILPLITDTTKLLWDGLDEGKNILLEGAQGSMLDIDHGTYPFVTSSSTISAGSSSGSGIPPNKIEKIIGITKAYCTRVGNGPFPTEQNNTIGQELGQKGCEFGTTTGRKRRCGWLDAIALKYACKLNGCTDLALMKLDVLDGFKEVKICTHYLYNGEKITHVPSDLENVEPVYESFEGWDHTAGIKDFKSLPNAAKTYIQAIQSLTGTKVSIISTSPERDDTIII